MKGIEGAPHLILRQLRGHIIARFPELAPASFTLLTAGWDSLAVDVDDRIIFKFPRHAVAREALVREVRLLDLLAPRLTMPVPVMTLVEAPVLFSRHAKIAGAYLLPEDYAALDEAARRRLAGDMALFFAELHALDRAELAKAGARPIRAWLPVDEIKVRLRAVLSGEMLDYASRTLRAWEALGPDPHGATFGFFDGHGWNMAFDLRAGRLCGIYDFGDSGFGDLTQEFIYPSFIARDLTERIIASYERLTGRLIDRRRVEVLCGMLRLAELADCAEDPEDAPSMRRALERWIGKNG